MAKKSTVVSVGGTWVELSGADITAATIQNLGDVGLMLGVSADGSTPPAEAEAFLVLGPHEVIYSSIALAVMFPGATSAKRLWGRARAGATLVSVSHA